METGSRPDLGKLQPGGRMRNLVKGQEVEIEQTGVIGEVLEKEQLD